MALVFLCLIIFLGSLSWFTNHGMYLKVPAVQGRNVDEAVTLLRARGFEVVIQDSVYTDSVPKYTVVKQLPSPDATVKVNREVYLTINRAVPPPVSVPKLEGLSYRFALDLLAKNHLVKGDTTNRPDFMKGSVLEQLYNGARIASGTKVPWGSSIDLVVGSGIQQVEVSVPDLIGMTFADAKAVLNSKGISLAAVVPMVTVTDTASAIIYRQNPEPFDEENKPKMMKPGETMDLYLTPDKLDMDSLRKRREQRAAKLQPTQSTPQ
jgi:eukaryotic-like serine/threonine-protein kinase